MTGFTARYHGICDRCTEDIEPGDRVLFLSENALAHVECDTAPRPTPACPTCHIALPVSGICDDCDG